MNPMPSATPAMNPDVVSALISRIGLDGFGHDLDAALRAVAGFDLSAIIAYPDAARPVVLHDGLCGVSPAEVMQAYLDGTYLLDAVYTACKAGRAEGLYRLADLAPDAFFEAEYYNSPQVHPCISMETGALAEEIAFLVRYPSGTCASYSLMRSHGMAAFSAAEVRALATYAPVVRAAIRRQWSDLGAGVREEGMEAAFRSFATGLLSPQEQRIVSLVLRGHSSLSIGLVLGIAEGTVKNHRKHIHAKLGISSQAELFALFLGHLRA